MIVLLAFQHNLTSLEYSKLGSCRSPRRQKHISERSPLPSQSLDLLEKGPMLGDKNSLATWRTKKGPTDKVFPEDQLEDLS